MMAFLSTALIVFGVAGLAFGYVMIPGKRGGATFSGIPAVLIVAAVAAAALTFILAIVDHYDRRPNEHLYRMYYHWLSEAMLALLGVAVLLSSAQGIGLIKLPAVGSLAPHLPIYSDALKPYHPLLQTLKFATAVFAVLAILGGALGYWLRKEMPRTGIFLIALAMFGVSLHFLAETVDLYSLGIGHVMGGNGRNVAAQQNPSLFNAAVFTHLWIAAVTLVMSGFAMSAALLDRKFRFRS